MAEADADFFLRCHFHDLFHFGQHSTVFAAQADAFVIGMSRAPPEAVRRKRRKPDHFEIRLLQSDTDVFGTHPETHADAAVNFDPDVSLTARDQIVDVALSEM